MTERQLSLLRFIGYEIAQKSVAPSYEEMEDYMRFGNKSRIASMVESLIDQGYLTRNKHKAWSLDLTDKALLKLLNQTDTCPTCGQAIPQGEAA